MNAGPHHAIASALLCGDPSEAEDLLRGGVESDFLDWAARNRLGPVLYEGAQAAGSVQRLLRPLYIAAHADELALSGWVPSLLAITRDKGADMILFKGLGIAHHRRCYASPALRPLGDLDVFVRPAHLQAAIEAAQSLGFVFRYEDPAIRAFAFEENYQVALHHPRHGRLEIHHRLYRDIPSRATSLMMSRTETTEVYGQRVERLTGPDLFYVLAVHLAKADDTIVWSWLVDLLRLGEIFERADWSQLRSSAREWGGEVFLAVCLSLLADLWGHRPRTLPDGYEEDLASCLSFPERRALSGIRARLPAGPLGGDTLTIARRLSLRPTRDRSIWRRVICHPGVVCRELGVSSQDPWFVWHRIRHAGVRAHRAWRATMAVARGATERGHVEV